MRRAAPGTSIQWPSIAHTLRVNQAVYFSVEGNTFSRHNMQQMVHKSRQPEAILEISWCATAQWNLMFIGPYIIAIVDEWKTNLMSLAILFHLLCAQRVSDINISIIRSLRLCWWITTSVVLFSVRCVLELLVRLVLGGVRFTGWSTMSLTAFLTVGANRAAPSMSRG